MAFIEGNYRNNTLVGTNRDDTILGRGGNDDIFGRNGADYIDGGNGRDEVWAGNGRDTIKVDKADLLTDGGNGRDTAILDDTGTFDLRGELFNVETVEQGRGNATVKVDEDAFLTADGDTLTFDLGAGHHDTLSIFYDGSELDIDLVGGKIKFGETGEYLDSTLDLAGVEHLNFTNTDTGATGNYDYWLA